MSTIPSSPRANPVHYPEDRRFRVGIRRPFLWAAVVIVLVPVALAWLQYLMLGLPAIERTGPSEAEADLTFFPFWRRFAHYVNFLFLILLMRSGLSILMDHPRLYWNSGCAPGTEWTRLTPTEVPKDRVWTAKDDARYISPWLGLPGYRHTVGVARHWHFVSAFLWFLNGLVYVTLLFGSGQWRTLVPDSWSMMPAAWSDFVYYATFHFPPEPETLYRYNALQQLSYFGVIFILAPLSFLTGLAMSPAIDNTFAWYPKLFGGRQSARSIHFLLLLGYIAFLIVHVLMVVLHGFTTQMNHIVLGEKADHPIGAWLGWVGIGGVVAACVFTHWMSWNHPRFMQKVARRIHLGLMRRLFFSHIEPHLKYSVEDISPYHWPNGKIPTSDEWRSMAADGFRDYRLKVSGLVENPVELSLDDLRAMAKQEQVSMTHCIQGWSGIAQWGGLPMAKLIELVKPKPEGRVCVFHSFGEALYGGPYYDTQRLPNLQQSHCILAYEMNGRPLSELHGAPLRLRVENQLGYKMVKWIRAIEFVETEKNVGKGFGGKNEDDEYFDLIPEI